MPKLLYSQAKLGKKQTLFSIPLPTVFKPEKSDNDKSLVPITKPHIRLGYDEGAKYTPRKPGQP